MAQNKKPKQGKRAPAYSADSMVVCLIVGLILIALGVLIFLSTALNMSGDIFTLLRTLSSGLSGTLAIALPVIPIWGGVLVIMTTQRKAPVREFLLGTAIFVIICAIITLLTFSSRTDSLNDYVNALNLRNGVGGGMSAALARGFEGGSGTLDGYAQPVGGGFLGMLLAWPLWRVLGNGAGFGGEITGAVFLTMLALVAFLFMIRLDVKGISARMKQNSADRRVRREQQQLQQRQQELIWQQEQALQQEQLRQQQEALRQQMQQQEAARQQQLQRQRVQPAPQQNQPEPPDPWSGMMPAGTANWNQTQANMQPPLVQRVETPSRKPRKKPAKPQVGFQPTPEELGQMAAPQSMPDAQMEPGKGRKGLFKRDKDAQPDVQPGRRGIFNRPAEDDILPGEAVKPTRQPARRPSPAVNIAQPVAEEPIFPSEMEDLPYTPAAEPAQHTAYAPDDPFAPTIPIAEEEPANQPEPMAHPSDWRSATAPQPVLPAAEPSPKRSPYQKPAPQELPEEPAFDEEEPASGPLASETPVREGSFMARLRAAQAATNGQKTDAPAAGGAPQPAPRKSRKDTPSAWSQPDAGAGSASWRTGEEPQRPGRPTARSNAQAAQPARPAPQPAASWEETPPWEEFDAPEVQPAAPVTPVLSRETPQDIMWQPEIKTPPRRSMSSMPDGALMETEEEKPYVFPSMDLLKAPEPQAGISEEEDALRSRRLENTLQSFRVPAKVRHITHGPAISRFELELAAGIKVSKVTDLNRNIAMNMEVKSVRIEAPIPGKSLVGVEVPNRERATVTLREVLESEPMRKATKPLVVALGKDIAGTPIVCDLAKMPHLLIAGATGSGKSVCINTIINSLLYRCSPKEVRLILVDPKVVELQCYNGIPHLLVPVVSDPHKASGALAWAVGEMMDRYKRFQEAGVRAIDGYNEQMPEDERMPRIVIVIDELADLMMTCKKDVEERICRLAQLARAAGIHLIVATQRPSVDVITGLIKANIPSRIAFKVSSNVDSRTILDRIGAEQLLGYGDMLYMPTGEFTPIRVQGCFLSDPEVNRITDFIRESCPATYDPVVLEELEKLQSDSDNVVIPDSGSDDYVGGDGSLLLQCVEMAVNDGQVSTSLIQRRLKLGYARAGRLVDEMEKRGIVSQKDGAKPRMCLISREEFEMMKDAGQFD